MGQHGLVGTTDESLLPLHDALKLEFRRVVDAYKGALQRLEDLSLSNKNHPKTVAHGPAPIQASHQRQLSLRSVPFLLFWVFGLFSLLSVENYENHTYFYLFLL